MTIGERIKQKRIELGLSQTDLAKRIGISKELLYRYEKGKITTIPYDRIVALAFALGMKPNELLGWQDTVSGHDSITYIGTVGFGAEEEFLKKFRMLDEIDHAKIMERMDIMLEDEKYREKRR